MNDAAVNSADAATYGTDAIAGQRARWRAAGMYGTELLGQAMDAAAREHGDDAFVFLTQNGERTVTLGEITSDAYRLAWALRRRGVGSGDAVAVQLPDGLECVVAYRAAIALGVTLVPIPAIYGEKEVTYILSDSRARCLITADRWRSSDYVSALPRVIERTGVQLPVVVGDDVPDGCLPWTELTGDRQPGDDRPPPVAGITAAHEAAIIYTSGSTANPKGARHSHETLLYELRQAMPSWRLRDARWLSVLPFAHMAGFLTVCRPLLFGGPMVSTDRWDSVQALELLERFKITSCTLPPYHLTTLLEAARTEGVDRMALRDVLVGSTAVQAALVRSADAVGCRAYRCYGSSEHPTISSGGEHDSLDLRADTDGEVYPDVRVRIVDEDDNDVPPGTSGEIVSTGPDLFLGYTDPAATAAAFTADGYYRTGDIGILDGDRLTVTGRRKDIIIRGGENLSPEEIEDVLGTHPAVAEVAVIGAPDPRYGERPWAFVRTRDGRELTLAQVREHFRAARVARQKTPEGLTLVEEFPRTAAGKVRKNDLRKLLLPRSQPHGSDQPASGTLPSRAEIRRQNVTVIAQYRARGGHNEPGAMPLVLITTTGAKTGTPHTTPVCVREDGGDLIIAGSRGGVAPHPQWYRNLLADPELTVEYAGETYRARAETVPNGPERDRLFAMMAEVITELYRYQDRCRDQRQIPVIRLTRM